MYFIQQLKINNTVKKLKHKKADELLGMLIELFTGVYYKIKIAVFEKKMNPIENWYKIHVQHLF
jgi:hypothetical protein